VVAVPPDLTTTGARRRLLLAIPVLAMLLPHAWPSRGVADPPPAPTVGDVQFCFLIASKAEATEQPTSVRIQIAKPKAPALDVTIDFPKGTKSAQMADAFADRLMKAGHTVQHVAGSKCIFVFGVTEYDGSDPTGIVDVTFGQSEGPRRMSSTAAEASSPTFKYRGWVEADRWGGTWLSNGVHSVRFAKDARQVVGPFLGKPVEIESGPLLSSSPVPQELQPVGAIRAASPRLGGRAGLDLFIGDAQLHAGGTQMIQLRLTYKGPDAIEFRLRDFRLLVRRVGKQIDADTKLDVRERDGPAWDEDGTATDVLDEGKGNHDTTWVLRSPGEATTVVKGEYSYSSALLLTGLPSGEYETWATFDPLTPSNLSREPGVRYKRIAFDVK